MRVLLALLLFCGFVTSAMAQVETPLHPGDTVEPLHPGDTIQISVWQDPKLNRQLVIGPDGMISFPLAGHIRAGGLTPQALEQLLRRRLQKNYTGRLDVTVSLAAVSPEQQLESKPRIYITGQVLKPGAYIITSNTTVVQALALAGGLGAFAAARRIQIHRQVRGTDSTYLFDYRAYEDGTDAQYNITLRPGDTIIVPQRGLFE
jgi:polysaccharide export outer membrane protein